LQYWAEGSSEYAAHLLMELISRLKLSDRMRDLLGDKEKARAAETDTYMVDRLVHTLAFYKHCRFEQARREYLIGLALVMPPLAHEGDQTGWMRRVCARLGVLRGLRSAAQGSRPYASTIAQGLRAAFDALLKVQHLPLREGDTVQTRHGPAELMSLRPDGSCVLIFSSGDATFERQYPVSFGNGKGSARLHRPPLQLMPRQRATRSDAVPDSVRHLILELVKERCPTSPCQRDVMTRRLGPFIKDERAAYIQSETIEALYAAFRQKHSECSISLSQFKLELPWNMKKAYRETCMCRTCLNFKWHAEALNVAAKLLEPLLETQSAQSEDDADSEAASEPLDPELPLLRRLLEFADLSSKRKMADLLVCSEGLGDQTKADCIHGKCTQCGFGRLWTALRVMVVKESSTGQIELAAGASPLWLSTIEYSTVKPSGANSHANDENALRYNVTATVVEFLDELMGVARNWVPHRYHLVQAKLAAQELNDNATPGMLVIDSDWSENGDLSPREQMQSEYWSIKSYSLFVMIAAFLRSKEWKDRLSPLRAKDEVTVQPEGAPADSCDYVSGSFFATVSASQDEPGEGVMYDVVKRDGTPVRVPRRQLRLRVWHRIAAPGLTDDKRHVGVTTQAFLDTLLEFFRLWQMEGRASALAFAAKDQLVPSVMPCARENPPARSILTHLLPVCCPPRCASICAAASAAVAAVSAPAARSVRGSSG
jgi:hypothetical protein